MNILEAVVSVFQNWNNFSGRACRSEFWYFCLALGLASNAIVFFEIYTGMVTTNHMFDVVPIQDMGILSLIFFILTFIPSISVTSRRLQDRGVSGWWQLSYITIIGILVITIICIFPGKKDENKWGKNPLQK